LEQLRVGALLMGGGNRKSDGWWRHRQPVTSLDPARNLLSTHQRKAQPWTLPILGGSCIQKPGVKKPGASFTQQGSWLT